MEKQDLKNCGAVTLIRRKDGEKVIVQIYIDADNRIYPDGQEVDLAELMRDYKDLQPIKDVINKKKELEKKPQEEEREEPEGEIRPNGKELPKEREKDEKELQKEKEEPTAHSQEENKEPEFKASGTRGQIDLDMMVNGETLRKVLGLKEDDKTIAPVSREKLLELDPEGSYPYKEGFIVIDNAGNGRPLKGDVLEPDRQEGNNSFDQDLNIEEDGSLEYESNLASYKIKNRPNLYLSTAYDKGTSTRETKVSYRSGREGDDEAEFTLLKEEQDANLDENSDARTLRMERDGIGKSEDIIKRKEEGCEEDRVEDIDNNPNNDMHEHVYADDLIPGTDRTWRQFADMCGYRGEGSIEKAQETLENYKKNYPEVENQQAIENIHEEIENEMPGPNRDKR